MSGRREKERRRAARVILAPDGEDLVIGGDDRAAAGKAALAIARMSPDQFEALRSYHQFAEQIIVHPESSTVEDIQADLGRAMQKGRVVYLYYEHDSCCPILKRRNAFGTDRKQRGACACNPVVMIIVNPTKKLHPVFESLADLANDANTHVLTVDHVAKSAPPTVITEARV